MNSTEMLDEILIDDEMKSFKEALRARSLEELSVKRRPLLRWALVPAAAAIVLIMTKLAFHPSPDYFVETVALSSDHRVTATSTVSIVTTAPSPAFARVQTRSTVDRLTDDEMLAMFTGIPCGLVGNRLVFLEPEDEKKYFGEVGG